MAITVLYFASLRETLGKSQETLDSEGISNVADIWRRAGSAVVTGRILVAINQEYADLNTTVRDGDEVAFFPPVTGG